MNYFRSNKIKSQLQKIFWITIAWTLVSLYQFLTIYASILDFNIAIELDPVLHLKGSLLTGILAGLTGGSGLVFLWEKWLRNKGYAWALLSILLSYSLIFLFVATVTGLYYRSGLLGLRLSDPFLWQAFTSRIIGIGSLNSYFFWLFVVLATLIVMLVNDKYGPGVFVDFLLGKYFRPKREERIFMFLDLRSSTTIAEKLGEVQYFNFLKDVFRHATPGILYSKGEIYQYVGDEIVVSWKTEQGIRNANCIHCFFEIQRTLRQKLPYYQEAYGEIPEFKAGLHFGHVMTGEIGVVKRDIAFSGDVLNTTARIQSKCNELGVNILLSKPLLNQLALPPHSFIPRKIGDIHLRGKKQEMVLFTV